MNRLIRNWYAFDERFHGELKKKAEADLRKFPKVEQMYLMSGKYSEIEYAKSNKKEEQNHFKNKNQYHVMLSKEEWTQLRLKFYAYYSNNSAQENILINMQNKSEEIPVGKISSLQQDENRFFIISIIDEQSDRIKAVTVEWQKISFEEWWQEKKPSTGLSISEPAHAYALPLLPDHAMPPTGM